MTPLSIHLGDGAYASFQKGSTLILTANHHLPLEATDCVYVDLNGIKRLRDFIAQILDIDNLKTFPRLSPEGIADQKLFKILRDRSGVKDENS